MMNRFLGFGEKEGQKVARAMEKIKTGEAISNIKEIDSSSLFRLRQFYNG
jgi:DNA sulfur modification protein DndE